jgi:hypothetical protein
VTRSAAPAPRAWADPAERAAQLYDAKREMHYRQPLLGGWLHLRWFVALVGRTALSALTTGTTRVLAVGVYVASVGALF